MRTTLLLLVSLLGFTALHAEEYEYLTLVELDGTKTSMTAVGLTLSFGEGSLTACNAYTDETKTLSLGSLASLNFSGSDETTAIHAVQAEGGVEAVYTLQGRQLPVGTPLKKGIYIIRRGSTIQKVNVR